MLLRLEVAELDGLVDGALGDALHALLGALDHAAVVGGADLPRGLDWVEQIDQGSRPHMISHYRSDLSIHESLNFFQIIGFTHLHNTKAARAPIQ